LVQCTLGEGSDEHVFSLRGRAETRDARIEAWQKKFCVMRTVRRSTRDAASRSCARNPRREMEFAAICGLRENRAPLAVGLLMRSLPI
jgi:hypothetical protein